MGDDRPARHSPRSGWRYVVTPIFCFELITMIWSDTCKVADPSWSKIRPSATTSRTSESETPRSSCRSFICFDTAARDLIEHAKDLIDDCVADDLIVRPAGGFHISFLQYDRSLSCRVQAHVVCLDLKRLRPRLAATPAAFSSSWGTACQ